MENGSRLIPIHHHVELLTYHEYLSCFNNPVIFGLRFRKFFRPSSIILPREILDALDLLAHSSYSISKLGGRQQLRRILHLYKRRYVIHKSRFFFYTATPMIFSHKYLLIACRRKVYWKLYFLLSNVNLNNCPLGTIHYIFSQFQPKNF